MKQHKKIPVIILLVLLCITGTAFFLNTGSKEVIKVENKSMTEDATACEPGGTCSCKKETAREEYGKPEDINAELSSARILTVSGVSNKLKAVIEMSTATGSFRSSEIFPTDGTIVYTIPTNSPVDGSEVPLSSDSIVIYFYPIVEYRNDERGILCTPDAEVFYVIPTDQANKMANAMYDNPICVNFRNQYGGVQELLDAIPACNDDETETEYTESSVQQWIKTAVDIYNFKQQALANQKPLTPDDANTVSDPSKLTKLMCDPYTADVLAKDGTVEQYANSKTYNAKKTVYEGTYCKTVCKETVTVNYQAPVATQAGLCFAYRVEIKSKVECSTESTNNTPQRRPLCVPRASCYGTYDSDHDQGGPSEDFDSCVQSCDGGKYSQKCINSCYKEVYNEDQSTVTKTANMLSYQDSGRVVRMANDNVSYNGVTCNNTFTGTSPKYQYDVPNADGRGTHKENYSAEQVYAFRAKYPGGYYSRKADGTWEWNVGLNPDGTEAACPSQLGYYYYSNINLTNSAISGFRTSFDSTSARHYSSWGNGFKMQDSSRFHCDSTCSWVGNCADNSLHTAAQVEEDYQRQLEAQAADWKKCNESVSCNETTTAYTITVDKDDKDSPNYNVYETTQQPGHAPSSTTQKNNSKTDTLPGDGIIEDYSGHCYSKEDGWEYRNVLSFPETWLSVKSGLTTNKKPKNESHYVYLGNTFCTSTHTDDVNVDWYDWKVNDNGDVSKLTDKKKSLIEKNRVDNINVRIGSSSNKLWGLMGWNFDVNCFFAVADPNTCTEECCGTDCDPTTPPSTPPTTPPTGGGGDDGGPNDTMPTYTFRSISLNDVFPPSSSNPEGRAPRYNWSCDASNTTNSDYIVQPSATIASIEAKGDSIYNNSDELDYEINLTQGVIKKVKEYNDSRKNYLDYDESAITKKVDGVTVYTSDFLTKVLGSAVKKRGIAGCNNQVGNTCSTEIIKDSCYNALNIN